MKQFYIFVLSVILLNAAPQAVVGQNCSSPTPLYYVDLTGSPSGVWQSPPVLRGGDCCGTDVNCIEFIVTLDSMATGILFDIVAGATPGGALYYQVNCGPLTSIGTPICLNGTGPHDITFCKPGNNLNVYQIASIPIPDVTGTEWVSESCIGHMSIQGLDSATTTWSSIPANPLYNSFLSCTAGCNNVTVTPTGTFPPYIDYQVCGYPIGGCYITPFCDTMRINFVTTLDVAITPQDPVICFGAPPATLTANPSGGIAPFNYVWSTGATTQSIAVSIAGTYYVSITDSMNCSIANDSVMVSTMASTITALAGPNQVLCLNNTAAQLNGAVIAATGGQWIGGAGTFTPNDSALNAIYTPTAFEISNGSIQLSLVTTGNNTCPADTDQVIISLTPNPAPQITGLNVVCEYSASTYSTTFISGHTYLWNVTGGTITNNLNNSIIVQWNGAGAGTVTVTETNALLCDSTITINVVVSPQPAPVINGPVVVCTTTTTNYSVAAPVPGNIYAWNVTGGIIVGPANGTSLNVLWNATGTATISLLESTPLGCDSAVSVTAVALNLPAPQIAGPDTVCAMQTITYTTPFVAGNTYNWNIAGGTVVSTSNNSVTVNWPASGSGSVSVTESNTSACDSTVTTTILIAPQPIPVINGALTTCTTTTTSFSAAVPVPGNTYAWNVTGGTIVGSSSGSSINVGWSSAGTATITLTESNSLGCDSTVSVTATVLTQPVPTIAGPDTICEMQTSTYTTPYVAGNTYNWNVTGGSVVSVNNNTITIMWPANGPGSVSLTESNTAACDSTVSTNIVVAPQPVPVITGALTNCTTTTTTFSVAVPVPGNTYAWNVMGGTIVGASNGSSINVAWTTPGTAIITLTQSNSLGCDSTVSVTATTLTQPAPNIAGPDTVCTMQTITYSTPFVAGNSYFWTVTGGSVVSSSNNTITVNWPANGTGSITVTESNTSNCNTTVSTSIIIAPQPAPVINGAITTCTTTTTSFSVAAPVPGNMYSWTVTGGTIVGSSTGTSVNVAWSFAGAATITLTESNSLGCDSTVSVTATVLTQPIPQIAGPDTVCALHTFTYSTLFVAGNTYTWNVTGGTVVSNNNNSITVSWPANGSGTVTLTESNSAACVTTVTENIVVRPQPVPVITGTLTSCSATYSQFTAINTTAGNTYGWSITGGSIIGPSDGTSVYIYWNNSGTAVLSFTETNNWGCDSTVSVSINVLQRPEPVINGAPMVCNEVQATYTVTTYIPSHSYFWSVTNGSIVGLNVGNSVEVLWNTAGTGNVTLRQVSPNGCDSTTVLNVVVNALPTPAIFGPPIVCENEPASYLTPQVPGNTYQWSTTGGVITSSSTLAQVTVFWYSGPMANLYLTETTNEGCSQYMQLPVQIREKPEPAIQGNIIGCIGTTQNNYSTIPQPGITYSWSTTGGLITSGSGSPSISVQWQNAGTQTITLIATNAISGCDSVVTLNVQTGALPDPVIQTPSLSGCIPINASFTGNVLNPAFTYIWDFGDGSTATGPFPTHSYDQPGTYNIELIASNNTGCVDTVTAVVNAYPVPQAAFNLWHGTGDYYANISNMTLTNLSTGATGYFWTFGDGANSQQFEPQYQYTVPGEFTIALVVTNQYGCQDVASTRLEVKLPENLYIPNAFTPNGDNKNDYFGVSAYNIDDFQINIFNRWGRIIYSSADPNFQWDGTDGVTDVINDVYVYAVKATGLFGTKFNLTGTVTVVR